MFLLKILEFIETDTPIYAFFILWYGNPLLNYKHTRNIRIKGAGVDALSVDPHLHAHNIVSLI
jgi:hypothetical protein